MENSGEVNVKPLMFDKEIEIVSNLFVKHKPRSVLEWGSGFSTLYFSKLCNPQIWDAVEHDPLWYSSLVDRVQSPIKLHFTNDPQHYVDLPGHFGYKYDFILIDGRMRRRCLLHAYELVNRNGIIVLHDADRTWYHSAMQHGYYLGRRLWVSLRVF